MLESYPAGDVRLAVPDHGGSDRSVDPLQVAAVGLRADLVRSSSLDDIERSLRKYRTIQHDAMLGVDSLGAVREVQGPHVEKAMVDDGQLRVQPARTQLG